MTTTLPATEPRAPALDRTTAMRLAETEFARYIDVLRELTPQQWAAPTECPGWDVRAIAGHSLGEAEMSASMRENMRQMKLSKQRAKQQGGELVDAMTALQVDEHAHLAPEQLLDRWQDVAPKAVRGRRRTPWFIRRVSPADMAFTINGHPERWRLGYLIDVILTRDPWMHRIDICRATGATLVLTADHDGVIVADVVREWATRHGQPCSLHLTGPAGGTWQFGTGAAHLELDAVEFCRILSGRKPDAAIDDPANLLATEVPF